MTEPIEPHDPLGDELRALGATFDVAPEHAAVVRDRILDDVARATRPVVRDRSDRRRIQMVQWAVAAAVVAIAGIVAVAPAREAVADWLGIGGVRVTNTDAEPPPPAPSPVTRAPADLERDLADARRAVPFEVRLPDAALVGELRAVEVDDATASPVLVLTYRDVTVVQVASGEGALPSLEKLVGADTSISRLYVGDDEGLWLAGAPHAVGHLGPDGEVLVDSVRRAGNVLLWSTDGVTMRIEGAEELDDARAIADSLL